MRRLRSEDRGSGTVEFIGWSTLILVPVIYLVVSLSQVQAAAFAVASAADSAARVLSVDHSAAASARATTAVELALSDQGVDTAAAEALSVRCAPAGCGEGMIVRVEAGVGLPGLGDLTGRIVTVDAERAVAVADGNGPP